MTDKKEYALVYSSDEGRICPECGNASLKCKCKKNTSLPVGDGIARVRKENKGRGGKTVSTITGLPLDTDAIKALASELKKRCGCGGTVSGGIIEIQGDRVDMLIAELSARGLKAKRSGG